MSARDFVPALALIAQAVLQVLWHGFLRPPQAAPELVVAAVALSLLPLAALIPAALHSRRRLLLVGGIVSLLYFSHGVMELWASPEARVYATLETLFATMAILGLRKVPRPA